MPKQITVTPAWSPSLTVPADGDLASEDSLEGPFSQLANNARYLFDAITLQGVLAIRGVADLNALKALATPTHGQVAYVYGRGIYAYLEGATPNEDPPFIVAPTAGGPGRWYHPLASLLAGARSFVTTTAANKVAADVIPNGVIGVLRWDQQGSMPAMNTTATEIVGFALTPPNVRAGDLFHVDWQGRLRIMQPGSHGLFVPVVADHTDNRDASFHVGTVWTAQTNAVTFKGRFATGGGDVFLDGGQIRCIHFRP
jgi:hypothetical protein